MRGWPAGVGQSRVLDSGAEGAHQRADAERAGVGVVGEDPAGMAMTCSAAHALAPIRTCFGTCLAACSGTGLPLALGGYIGHE